jgi:hypothetical protein
MFLLVVVVVVLVVVVGSSSSSSVVVVVLLVATPVGQATYLTYPVFSCMINSVARAFRDKYKNKYLVIRNLVGNLIPKYLTETHQQNRYYNYNS